MPSQAYSYSELGEAWGISPEAARKRAEGMRLPRERGNDGRARIRIDLSEITPRPPQPKSGRRAAGDRAEETETLRAHIGSLRSEVERLAALAAAHRGDFERERDRAERATADLTGLAERLADAERERATCIADAEKTRAEAARIRVEADAARVDADAARAEFDAWRARRWWQRAWG